jgi:hypothetical protein
MVEIGSFLGDSARQWLSASPDLVLICIDPWEDGDEIVAYARDNGRQELCDIFAEQDGQYRVFLSRLWDFRERVIPVRGFSPAQLFEIHRLGICPELIYLDSNKTGEELEICESLFPEMEITGDDWTWGRTLGFPIRRAVRDFVKLHRYSYRVKHATWVMNRSPFSFWGRLAANFSRFRGFVADVLGRS